MQRDREYMLDIIEAAKIAIQYIDEITNEYDDIDIGIVWETVKNDLPLLVDSLENILGTHYKLFLYYSHHRKK